MTNYTYTPSFMHPREPRRRFVRGAVMLLLGVIAAWGVGRLGGQTFTVIRDGIGANIDDTVVQETPKPPKIADDPEYEMPRNDKDRLDVLLLGIRGEDDPQNGGLLTDTIMLLSMDTRTGRAALISIPRDLTVRVTDDTREKINTAYIHNGIGGSKKLFSRILGIGVDHAVVLDFAAFRSVVDALGGITVTLDKPFTEPTQWGYEFSLPTGENALTGEQALYYVRSRYGSSDFDRARRQQQVMVAIRNKVQGLNLASDPLKALELVTTARKHIQTDLDILDLGTIKDLMAQSGQMERIRRYQLTTENVLYETRVDGIYELLPRGDTLAHIKEFFRTVLTDTPVLLTPSPTP